MSQYCLNLGTKKVKLFRLKKDCAECSVVKWITTGTIAHAIHKSADRISVRFKRFHIRPSSIVGFSSFTKPVSLAWIMDKKSKE
jgi:hypothetical protein